MDQYRIERTFTVTVKAKNRHTAALLVDGLDMKNWEFVEDRVYRLDQFGRRFRVLSEDERVQEEITPIEREAMKK